MDRMPIVGYPGYLVTRGGEVISLPRTSSDGRGGTRRVGGKALKTFDQGKGYQGVNLLKEGKQKRHLIHRLVLEAFVGPCPEGMECRHLNGDPTDNRLENLCWGTPRENADDRIRHGTNSGRDLIACTRGHSLEVERNLVPSKLKVGRRNCLACSRANSFIRHNPHLRPEMKRISDEKYQEILSR